MANLDFLPYGKQYITEEDISAVVDVLRSDWLTQGPIVPAFEEAIGDFIGAGETIACANGTAALHLAMLALGIGKDDAIVTTPNTFVASANCARFVGAEVRFADINWKTGLIDPQSIAQLLAHDHEHKIKAIIPVHFAGQPADLVTIHDLARRHGAWVVDDACHALGASYMHQGETFSIGGNPHSDMTVFSFHPVKHVATGEGGAITTGNPRLAERLRLFRNHGISRQTFLDDEMAVSADGIPNPWYYEMQELGLNYRLTDIQAALGLSQMKRLPWSLERRRETALGYTKLIEQKFSDNEVSPLMLAANRFHAYHLFVVLIDFERIRISRAVVMNRLRAKGIGTQVHYIPVHLQPYYRHLGNTGYGHLPQAESYYAKALSLPMYPNLTSQDIERVVDELARALAPVKQIQTADRPSSQSF